MESYVGPTLLDTTAFEKLGLETMVRVEKLAECDDDEEDEEDVEDNEVVEGQKVKDDVSTNYTPTDIATGVGQIRLVLAM